MRHVPPELKSEHAKDRDRPVVLVPFNCFDTQKNIDALNAMAKDLQFPSRAEMIRFWFREKIEAHKAAKAVAKEARAAARAEKSRSAFR